MLWSSEAVAKLNASIGFQAIAFEEKASVVLWRGVFVRRSYRTMEWSVPEEARIDVSVWLNEQAVKLFTAVGQARMVVGEECGRVVS